MVSWSVSQWKTHTGQSGHSGHWFSGQTGSFSCGQWRSQSSTAITHAVIQSWPPSWPITEQLMQKFRPPGKVLPTMHSSGRTVFSHTCQSNNHTRSETCTGNVHCAVARCMCVVPTRPGPLALGLIDSRYHKTYGKMLCTMKMKLIYSVKKCGVVVVDMQKV